MTNANATISDMLGVVMRNVENIDNEILRFTAEDGRMWECYHEQDCCETVTITDIAGNLSDLVGTPLLKAEEVSSADAPAPALPHDSWTWTFYTFATLNGYVDVRWFGSSNGYYSEKVDFRLVNPS